MLDREKVIKGLECCNPNEYHCGVCPYDDGCESCARCKPALHSDAIALLKAQEPLMVEERAGTDTINCPKCGQQFARVGRDKSVYLDLDEEPDYCWKCGQAVKWDE